eukprot:2734385-Rhodomonas_salina.2
MCARCSGLSLRAWLGRIPFRLNPMPMAYRHATSGARTYGSAVTRFPMSGYSRRSPAIGSTLPMFANVFTPRGVSICSTASNRRCRNSACASMRSFTAGLCSRMDSDTAPCACSFRKRSRWSSGRTASGGSPFGGGTMSTVTVTGAALWRSTASAALGAACASAESPPAPCARQLCSYSVSAGKCPDATPNWKSGCASYPDAYVMSFRRLSMPRSAGAGTPSGAGRDSSVKSNLARPSSRILVSHDVMLSLSKRIAVLKGHCTGVFPSILVVKRAQQQIRIPAPCTASDDGRTARPCHRRT